MSEPSPTLNSCPQCGAALPSAATKGLCPKCLMAEAMVPTQDAAEPAPSRKSLAPAELAPYFPQLEILECLGRGGMGVVYKARQKSLNRFVALKLLAPERVADAKFAQRFAQEAQALATLNQPSIVTIHDFGQAGGFYFLLMEFVDGVNLRQAMKAGRFTPEQALAVVPPVCEALQYAHEHGIVHRDIKPENILLDKAGRVKIADFGIAKMLHVDGSDATGMDSQPAGTPQYMAPEQKEHRRTDHRADIYSLGVVLYELLTGEMPTVNLQPPSRKVLIDVRFDKIVLRALEMKPELRYQTAADFRTQVETMVLTPNETRTSSTPSGFLKVATSTFTTPAQLATASGQFFCYRTRGQLTLDDRQITHSRGGVIPLAAIRDVSIGQYPRSMNPLGIDLLSVTYEEGGQRKQVLLSPMEGYFAMPGTWNARAAEWATAIREAATAATGRAPTTTPSEQLGVPGSHVALLTMFLMLGVFMTVLTALFSPGASFGRIGLMSLFIFGMAGFFLLLLQRRRAKSTPGSARALSPLRIVSGVLVLIAVLFGLWVLISVNPSRSASGVSNFICIPVGVSNNVVVVDVNAEVAPGGVEVKAALDGPRLTSTTEAALGEALSPPLVGTLVKPTPYSGNHPWRILSSGRQTWRLAFVLPDAALAKEALENLHPIGPPPAKPRRTFTGMLFEVGQPGGAEYRASLNVTLPVTTEDPNWVGTANYSQSSESGVSLTWELLASQPGTVRCIREGNHGLAGSAQLERNPKSAGPPIPEVSKLYGASIQIVLSKIDAERVLLITRIGKTTSREELTANFRELSEELLRARNQSFKATRPTTIELCQVQGQSFTVQVDALPASVTTSAPVKVVNWSLIGVVGIAGLLVIAGIARLVTLVRKDGFTRKILLLIGVPVLLLIAGLSSLAAWKSRQEILNGKRAMLAARVAMEEKLKLRNSASSEIEPALAAWQQGNKGGAVSNFVAADWNAGPIFPPESMLSLTESQFLAKVQPASGRGVYARTGILIAAMKWPTPPSWGEAKNGLRVGILFNGAARMGAEVKVELWIHNSGTQDVKFRQCGRTDVGLHVMAQDSTGKDHDAEITPFDGFPFFQPIQLPPVHILKVKEFTLLFDLAANTRPPAQTASLHLPPGDYKLRATWGDAKATNVNEGEWTGELTSGEVDLKIAAANASAKPPGDGEEVLMQPAKK